MVIFRIRSRLERTRPSPLAQIRIHERRKIRRLLELHAIICNTIHRRRRSTRRRHRARTARKSCGSRKRSRHRGPSHIPTEPFGCSAHGTRDRAMNHRPSSGHNRKRSAKHNVKRRAIGHSANADAVNIRRLISTSTLCPESRRLLVHHRSSGVTMVLGALGYETLCTVASAYLRPPTDCRIQG
jgi:hypothetical protein